jgi:hypothetical protein
LGIKGKTRRAGARFPAEGLGGGSVAKKKKSELGEKKG